MFRIVCDPSSGSIELYLTEIRSGSLMFVVCLVGVWQRNFEPVVCVCVRYDGLGTTQHSSSQTVVPYTNTHHWFSGVPRNFVRGVFNKFI